MLSPKTLANLTKEPQRKMKLIDMGPSNMSSGSTLSTKRRLFQFTTPSSNVNPVKAKMVPSRPTKKVPLVNLGFKKNLALPPPRDTGTRADHQAKAVDEPLFSEDDNFAGSNKDDIPSPQPPQPDLHPAEERSVAFSRTYFSDRVRCWIRLTDILRINLPSCCRLLIRLSKMKLLLLPGLMPIQMQSLKETDPGELLCFIASSRCN